MAKTNPCQICGEVTAAEFTLAAAYPQASWFEQLVVNICEGCLLNAAYQRVQQLAEAAQAEPLTTEEPALETIEAVEVLEPVEPATSPKMSPKRARQMAEANGPNIPEEAAVTADG